MKIANILSSLAFAGLVAALPTPSMEGVEQRDYAVGLYDGYGRYSKPANLPAFLWPVN